MLEPILAGNLAEIDATYNDDASYVRDLGLMAKERPLRVAKLIYREVIARVLALPIEDNVTVDPRSFVLPDGRLDFRKLIKEFASFGSEHGDVLTRRDACHEAAPQFVLISPVRRSRARGAHAVRGGGDRGEVSGAGTAGVNNW